MCIGKPVSRHLLALHVKWGEGRGERGGGGWKGWKGCSSVGILGGLVIKMHGLCNKTKKLPASIRLRIALLVGYF